MNSGLKQHVEDFKELIFLAFDAGRITGSRGRELMGFDDLLTFRHEYQTWREAQKKHEEGHRNQRMLALYRLHDISQAMAAATDDGEKATRPDVALLDSLEEAIAAVRALGKKEEAHADD